MSGITRRRLLGSIGTTVAAVALSSALPASRALAVTPADPNAVYADLINRYWDPTA